MNRRSYVFVGALALLAAGPSLADDEANGVSEAEFASRWTVEVGTRYWYSSGETKWDHNASGTFPALGNPSSVGTYSDLTAHSGEGFLRVDHDNGLFLKGYLGGGAVVDGNGDAEDYLAGQVKNFDASAELKDGELVYFNADIGFTFFDSTRRHEVVHNDAPSPGFRLAAFTGFHYWNESIDAFGAQCNPDDVGGANCGAPGSIAVPFSTRALTNDVTWSSLRVGFYGEAQLTGRVKLSGEAAWVPYTHMDADESRYLRTGATDLGPVPNVLFDGSGHGFMLESIATFDLTRRFSLGVGGRYWHLESDGTVEFGPNATAPEEHPLNNFDSTRYGVFVQGSVKLF